MHATEYDNISTIKALLNEMELMFDASELLSVTSLFFNLKNIQFLKKDENELSLVLLIEINVAY